ncbi:hypothetical protein GOODEAATRI_020439 [Goodea atripinnis]|uniref:I/LWEQ domain-containing protein n=1 Tax=Goodea atripinnis TaxID=208336 RepID=A0ABV0MJC9_9TELE
MVAAATSNLCEAANASVQGHASEEKLISSAKQVAASTAQLLVACKIIAAQEEMLRKERELEEARKKLAQIRQQQYKFLPSELREDEG